MIQLLGNTPRQLVEIAALRVQAQHDVLGTHHQRYLLAGGNVAPLRHDRETRQRQAHVLVIDFEYTRRQDVGLADEIGHEVGLRLLVHLARCTDLLDGAIPHDRDAVRHGQRLALVMCHVDGSDAQLRVEISNPVLHFLAQLLVQRAQRLVEQQDAGLRDQYAGERDALLLASTHFALVALFVPA